MFLTREELIELTGKKRRASQAEALRQMGIEHKLRGDGSVAVHEAHVSKAFGAHDATQARSKRIEPNWNAANA